MKALVNKRAEMKVYPLLLVCQSTGAVHTQVAHAYSTSVFMIQWNHFVKVRGRPTKVVSDQGSQLTSSDNTIKINSLNWEQVEGRGTRRKTDWEFVPAGCQWRNRLADTRVKALKVTLKSMLSGEKRTLSYSDLCTLLAMVANMVNK